MGQVIIAYEDSHGTKYGLAYEANLHAISRDYLEQAGIPSNAPFPQYFASLAQLKAYPPWASAIEAPSGLIPRTISLQIGDAILGLLPEPVMTTVNVVIGELAAWDALFPTGETPFPHATVGLVMTYARLLSATGESRNTNGLSSVPPIGGA